MSDTKEWQAQRAALAGVLDRRCCEYRDAIRRLETVLEAEYTVLADNPRSKAREDLRLLREASEMTFVAWRFVRDAENVDAVHKAMGAPGDWGYETPIGDALARAYGVRK